MHHQHQAHTGHCSSMVSGQRKKEESWIKESC